jgi:phosphatidylglycerol lysyltransferase
MNAVDTAVNKQSARSNRLRRLAPILSVALFALAVVAAYREVHAYHLSEIRHAITALPTWVLVLSAGMATLGYVVLSLYDWLALEYAREGLPYRRVLLTSLLSFAISNNTGHAYVSGGSIRYRFYSSWGVPATSIVKIVLFCSATYAIGVLTLIVASYLMLPASSQLGGALSSAAAHAAVLAAGLGLLTWWLFVLRGGKLPAIRGFIVELPVPSLALRQSLVAVADLMLASLVLYVPLSQLIEFSYPTFLLLFCLAQVAGTVSMIPGGIGVFEGSFLYLAPPTLSGTHLLAALIVYRVIYYFLPLAAAGGVLSVYELRLHRITRLTSFQAGAAGVQAGVRAGIRLIESAIPQILSVLLLIGAGVLLLSGALPALPERLRWLHDFLPLPLIEVSHLAGSLAGVLLLILSRAIGHRLDSAYYIAAATLGVGIVASLAKGLDYEEAMLLSVMLLILLPARKHFYRRTALLSLDYPPRWIVMSCAVIGLYLWLGFFSYRHVEYSGQLWWQFSLHANAPRFLRSAVAVATLIGGLILYRLMTRPAAPVQLPDGPELDRLTVMVEQAADSSAHLALVGDKRVLWSNTGKSFLCFDTTPGFWVAMGDPVGAADEVEEMIWRFRELADRYNAAAVFYQVGTAYLPFYLDLGAVPVKLGEEARVPLAQFGLEGKERAGLRQTFNKLGRAGLEFDVIARAAVPAIMPDLQVVSDRWLKTKRAKEKHFSLGYFHPDYLRRCDVAVLRRSGAIVAYANLWQAAGRRELSLDLMRYDPSAPKGVMEYLTIHLMLWGKTQGFEWFSLGMAPLSGLERRPLAPLWHKTGNVIFQLGGEFYNFEGLFRYKSKFDPVWRPRYLIVPSGAQIAPALIAVTRLIAGGLKGIFMK